MITTNHDKIYYRPFRKDFYTVVPEIAAMTDLGKYQKNSILIIKNIFLYF